MVMVSNFSFFLWLIWEFLEIFDARGSSICWPNIYIIDELQVIFSWIIFSVIPSRLVKHLTPFPESEFMTLSVCQKQFFAPVYSYRMYINTMYLYEILPPRHSIGLPKQLSKSADNILFVLRILLFNLVFNKEIILFDASGLCFST
jgi:hypothetical protein